MNKIALLLAGLMMLIWPCLGLSEEVRLNVYNNSQKTLFVIGPGGGKYLSTNQNITGLSAGSNGNEVTLSILLSNDGASFVGDSVALKFYMFCKPENESKENPVRRVALGDNCDGAARFSLSQDNPGLEIRKNIENSSLKLRVIMELGKSPTQINVILQ